MILQGIAILEGRKIRAWAVQGHLLRGEILTLAGRQEEARTCLSRAIEMYQAMGLDSRHYWLSRAQAGLDRLGPVRQESTAT